MIEDSPYKLARTMGYLLIGIAIAILFAMTSTSGCMTKAKEVYGDLTATPIPTTAPPTPEPTLEPTPEPTPTESQEQFMVRTNGYHMRDWLHYYRADVQGINGEGTKDLSQWWTVYQYKFLPSYHYHSVSWGTHSFFLEKPDPGNKYLFVWLNTYSDNTGEGPGDDVRQYLFGASHFTLWANGVTYYPDDVYNPSYQIRELDNTWTYAHDVSGDVPFGYKIVQEKVTGIRSAEKLEVLYAGRSNAVDGWIAFQVPVWESARNISVHGNFANLCDPAWWQLE